MSLPSYITGMSEWLWLIYIFLLCRGIVNLRPSIFQFFVYHIFFLPIVFLFLSLFNLVNNFTFFSVGIWSLFFLIGMGIGWTLFRVKINVDRFIFFPGSPFILILTLTSFILKIYFDHIFPETHPELLQDSQLLYIKIASSALIGGLPWGRASNYMMRFQKAYASKYTAIAFYAFLYTCVLTLERIFNVVDWEFSSIVSRPTLLLSIPIVFLFLSLFNLVNNFTFFSVGIWSLFFLIGMGIGWILFRVMIKVHKESGLIFLPGSPFILILALTSIFLKIYFDHIFSVLHPELLQDSQLLYIKIASSAIIGGLLWGRVSVISFYSGKL